MIARLSEPVRGLAVISGKTGLRVSDILSQRWPELLEKIDLIDEREQR
jgi:hypothetical protein